MLDLVLCSNCFKDQGLKLESVKIGIELNNPCPNCHTSDGMKLNKKVLMILAHRFFVRGSFRKRRFGGAPRIQFNEHHYGKKSLNFKGELNDDVRLLQETLKIGFFPYGPNFWMLGENEPLKALQDPSKRNGVVENILEKYPARYLSKGEMFYRIRISPKQPSDFSEFDSPPIGLGGKGRFDTNEFSIMYGSQDLNVCIHECRCTVEDDLYVATLDPTRKLKLLDLTELLSEAGVTLFESLDMAIHMLFLAGEHSYEISKTLARAAKKKGFDGLIYPSYFSLVRTGAMPNETTYGLSIRQLAPLHKRAKAQIIPNVAIFGKPIESGDVEVYCINRLVINRVEHDVCFGPVDWEVSQ
jgi:hypothetical protein